ncbi:YheC/YheD family protein [Neobacillus sp. LXY-1]|uniref:YheC/YheD family protein n=1 Tax=Neobacillus sp. LXY-1 TaxID=3379133 RepID=UPI003EE2CCFE
MTPISISSGKWTKHLILSEDDILVNHLPQTDLLCRESIWEYLDRFGAVVIKPSQGLKGYGVVKVSKLDLDQYEIHREKTRIQTDRYGLLQLLDKEKYQRKMYIVQERIPLARVEGKPFDSRIMVEREQNKDEWKVTGRLAKLAEKGYFITNVASDILPLHEALSRSNLKKQEDEPLTLIKKIDHLAIHATHQLAEYYTSSNTIGLDIGITKSGKIYIIEANLKPSRAMFKRLKE